MKVEISEFYKQQGFDTLYVVTNKEPRRVAILKGKDIKCKSMSYARYLYTSHHQINLPKESEIDHINNDKMDDRIENLQVLSKVDNIKKSQRKANMVTCVCPVCGKEFLFRAANLPFHPNPCCSRKCGGIKSHWK